jgi:hypothetical protein
MAKVAGNLKVLKVNTRVSGNFSLQPPDEFLIARLDYHDSGPVGIGAIARSRHVWSVIALGPIGARSNTGIFQKANHQTRFQHVSNMFKLIIQYPLRYLWFIPPT